MSDLVGNPEDRFSHNEVHIIFYIHSCFDLDLKKSRITLIRLCDFNGIWLNILTLISTNEYARSNFFIEKFMTFRARAITINRLCNMHRYSKTVIRKNNMIFSILLLKTLRRF